MRLMVTDSDPPLVPNHVADALLGSLKDLESCQSIFFVLSLYKGAAECAKMRDYIGYPADLF